MKIVIIGGKNKPLTFKIIDGLFRSGYDVQLVVVNIGNRKRKKPSFFNRLLNILFNLGLKRFIENKFDQLSSNIKKYCTKKGINYTEKSNINSTETESIIKEIDPDFIVLAGPPIIKENIFKLSKIYTINIHRSLLPKYAGLKALFWALYNNEKEVGATVHTVNSGIDAGELIVQRRKKVQKSDDLRKLRKWYFNIAPELIIEALEIIKDPKHKLIQQDFSQRTYYSMPTKEQEKELKKRLKRTKYGRFF